MDRSKTSPSHGYEQPKIVVVTDPRPIAELARSGRLDLLLAAGAVVIPDYVEALAVAQGAPLSDDIAEWMAVNAIRPGQAAWVVRPQIGTPRGPRLATEGGRLLPGGAHEHAVLRWIGEHVIGPALIVTEPGSMADLLAETPLPEGVGVVGLDGFVRVAEDMVSEHAPDNQPRP